MCRHPQNRLSIDKNHSRGFELVRHIVDKALLLSWTSVCKHVPMLDWMASNKHLILLVMTKDSVEKV